MARATAAKVRLSIGDDVVTERYEETGEQYTRRVYFVEARYEGSTRYWPDFVHGHDFLQLEDAQALLERVVTKWGAGLGYSIPAARLEDNEHWVRNTAPDPSEELAPFGDEWEREQWERLGY